MVCLKTMSLDSPEHYCNNDCLDNLNPYCPFHRCGHECTLDLHPSRPLVQSIGDSRITTPLPASLYKSQLNNICSSQHLFGPVHPHEYYPPCVVFQHLDIEEAYHYIFKLQFYGAQLLDSSFFPTSDLVSKCQIYIDLLWQRIHTIQTEADLENLGILD